GAGLVVWSVFSAVTSVISFLVGLRWGAVGVAAAFALRYGFIRSPFLWWLVTRKGPISLIDLCREAAPFALAGAVCFGVLEALQFVRFGSSLAFLAVCAVIAYAGAWGVLSTFSKGRQAMVEAIELVRTELPRFAPRF